MASKSKIDSKHIELPASIRTVTGKRVRSLRAKGLIPATVYGRDFKSLSVELPLIEFQRIYRIAKETAVVYLKVEKDTHPTLITQIQHNPVSDEIIHADFRRIDLTKKIETKVPVKIEGSATAVSLHGAIILTQAQELTIEALPANIPQFIVIDIAPLKEIGDEIKVKDLKASGDYSITDEPEKVIVSAVAHKEESLIAETTTTAPEVITEKAPTEEGAEAPAAEQKKS